MKGKLKKVSCLILCMVILASSIRFSFDALATEDTTTSDYLVQDDFSDATKTDELWTNTLSSKITDGVVVLSGTTSEYMLKDGIVQSGDKPLQLQFSADHSQNTNTYTGDGFRFYLLKGANSNIIFEYRKGAGAAVRIKSATNFSMSGVTANTDFKKNMDLTKKTIFTIDYDWSDWANNNLTITINVKYDDSTSSLVTQKIVFTHSGTDTDFNVGFYNYSNRTVCLYDVFLKSVNSVIRPFEETHSEILAKTPDTIQTSDVPALQAALDDLSTYDTYVQGVIKSKYPDLETMEESLKQKIIANWDGLDDFSDSYKTSVLWKNSLDEKIQNEEVIFDTSSSTIYELVDAVWGDGDRPLQFSFTLDSTNAKFSTTGVYVYLLKGDTSTLALNYTGYNALHGVNVEEAGTTSDFTTSDATIGTRDNKIISSLSRGEHTFTITYDWSAWDVVEEGASPQVTITVKVGTTTKTMTFTYTGAEDKFSVGFASQSSEQHGLDDVGLKTVYSVISEYETEHADILAKTVDSIQSSDAAALGSALNDLNEYDAYVQGKIKNLYPDLEAMQAKLKQDTIDNWNGFDDFSDSYKTSVVWNNGLEKKIVDGSVPLSGDSSEYTLSDSVWKEGNRPTKLVFSAYQTVKEQSNTSGLYVSVLKSDNASVKLLTSTWYSGGDAPNDNGFGYNELRYTNTTLSGSGEDTSTAGTTSSHRFWKTSTAGKSGNNPMIYSITYDWSAWDTVAEGSSPAVTIKITYTKPDGTKNTYSQTYTYVGDSASIPTTFNVGFQSVSTDVVLDDVIVEYENIDAEGNKTLYAAEPDFRLETTNTELSTYNIETVDEKAVVSTFGFDFSHKKVSMSYYNSLNDGTTETVVSYGAVVMPGEPAGGYESLLADAKILVGEEDGTVTNTACEFTSLDVEGVLPNEYTVRILNSEKNMGVSVTAIGYIKTNITDAQGVIVDTKYYYTYDFAQDSVTGLLKDVMNTYLANTSYVSGGSIVADSKMDLALSAYNASNIYAVTYDLPAIQTAATTDAITSDEQKALLKAIHFGITLGVDTEVAQ